MRGLLAFLVLAMSLSVSDGFGAPDGDKGKRTRKKASKECADGIRPEQSGEGPMKLERMPRYTTAPGKDDLNLERMPRVTPSKTPGAEAPKIRRGGRKPGEYGALGGLGPAPALPGKTPSPEEQKTLDGIAQELERGADRPQDGILDSNPLYAAVERGVQIAADSHVFDPLNLALEALPDPLAVGDIDFLKGLLPQLDAMIAMARDQMKDEPLKRQLSIIRQRIVVFAEGRDVTLED